MKGFLSHANDDPYKNVRTSKVLLLVHTRTKQFIILWTKLSITKARADFALIQALVLCKSKLFGYHVNLLPP